MEYPTILKNIISELSEEESYKSVCHRCNTEQPMPSIDSTSKIVELTRHVIFPGYFGNTPTRSGSIQYYIGTNIEQLYELLRHQIYAGLCFEDCETDDETTSGKKIEAASLAVAFMEQLPSIRKSLSTDVEAAYLGDPAAHSHSEVIFCYPAIKAIVNYRVAHALSNLNVPIIPRLITEMAHSETGIDINPEAQIGDYFAIDHGTGVVIGSTTIIGNNVKIYQGVTLGAKSFPLDSDGNPIKGIPRHPIVEDNVIIYAQATILGRITIGANSVIGGNVWVTNDVPPNSKIVQGKLS